MLVIGKPSYCLTQEIRQNGVNEHYAKWNTEDHQEKTEFMFSDLLPVKT